MVDEGENGLDFTDVAWESLYDTVDNELFKDKDAQLIYDSLRKRIRIIPFGDYLKRYIYTKAGLHGNIHDIPLKEYQIIIRDSFKDNHVPPSFIPTTAKLSALSKNWLTQQTVKRNVIFLLGFGLNMGVDDVNLFLTKALREPEINPKNPFEVICWYCYKNKFNYLKYAQLWELYEQALPQEPDGKIIYEEQTISVRKTMFSISDDQTLIQYVSKLKTINNVSRMSVTAREQFGLLYDKSRELIADLYNHSQEEKHDQALSEYQNKLLHNEKLYDYEIAKRISQFRSDNRKYKKEDISESDMEHIICSAIPIDRYGNLTPGKASKLNEQFAGKRFSRQHIGEICAGNAEVTRFDLITLNFFVLSQQVDKYPNVKQRYTYFVQSTNEILQKCLLGKLNVSNPYECFVLMCVLSEEPLSTYADVWELSYGL